VETKHIALLGVYLVFLGGQIASLTHGWHDALTPGFIGSALGQLGVFILTIYVGPPKDNAVLTVDPRHIQQP